MSFARFVGGMAKRVNQLKDERRAEDAKMRLLQEELELKNRLTALNEGFSKNFTFNGSSAIFRTSNDKSKPEAYAMETFANLPQVFDQLGINNSQDALEFFKASPDLMFAGNVAVNQMSQERDTSDAGETITSYGVQNFTGTDPRMELITTFLESSYLEQEDSDMYRPSYLKGYRSPDSSTTYTPPANLVGREAQVEKGIALEDYMINTYKAQNGVNNEANVSGINKFYFNTAVDANGKPQYTFDYTKDHAEFFSMLESGIEGSKIKRQGNTQSKTSEYKSETTILKQAKQENSTSIQNVDSIADELEKIIYGYTLINEDGTEGESFAGIRATGEVTKIALIINAFSNEQTGVFKQFKSVFSKLGETADKINLINNKVLNRTKLNRSTDGLGEDGSKTGNFLEAKAIEQGIDLEDAKKDNNYFFTNKAYGSSDLGDAIKIEDALKFVDKGGLNRQEGESFKNADGSETLISQAYKLQALQISLAFQMAIALQGHQGGKAVSDADFDRAWQLITGGANTSFFKKFTSLEADRESLEAAREVLVSEEIRNQAHINTSRGKRFKAEDLFYSMFEFEAARRGTTIAALGRETLFKNRGFKIDYVSPEGIAGGLTDEDFLNLSKVGSGLATLLPTLEGEEKVE